MNIPAHVPGLRWAAAIVLVYAVIWIALEGNLWRVTLLGCATALLLLGFAFQRWIAWRRIPAFSWIALCAALGTLGGFSSAVLTLIFMAVKTGLHAHGPEFDTAQITWIVRQIPWWTTGGLFAGLGLGLLYVALRRN